ncbi:MAG TPA: VanZ family protein [Rhodocyclaceae bacterium]|nr:VanZ family protein [Rhodocyclaceae bacterium]
MPALVRLSGLLALVYPALLLYGSLFPLAGWRDSGVAPLAFLNAPFPRYWTVLDLLVNVGLYLPLGFLWALWLLRWRWLQKIWWIATVPAVALSLGVEVVQNWLPTRVPSNLDLLCNGLGGLVGVLLARRWGDAWMAALQYRIGRWLQLDRSAELGVLLLGLWLVGQWVPAGPVFVSGDWRGVWTAWAADAAPPFSEAAALRLEVVAVAGHLLAVGLMLRELMHGSRWQGLANVCLFFLSAATARAVAAAFMVRTAAAFDWLTVGAQHGLIVGSLLLLPAFFLPDRWRRRLAIAALPLATLAINLAGPNPSGLSVLPPEAGGAFSNFVGLTELVALLWPLAALFWWLSRLRRSPIMAG